MDFLNDLGKAFKIMVTDPLAVIWVAFCLALIIFGVTLLLVGN